MDYHSLKRRELQALCKEHNIPANSANSVLADKLSALLNEKPKPKARTCMKSSVETRDGGEPAESKRQAKKVRFSPNNDLVEYELRSGEKQKDMVPQVKTRRKSVAKKGAVDNDINVELVEDTAQIPVRVTRSRVQSSVKDVVPNNETKKGRREAKDVEKGTDVNKETEDKVAKVTRSKKHTAQSKKLVKEVEESPESVEETVVGRVRVTRSKAQTLMEGGTGRGAFPHVKKTGKQVKTDEHSVEPSKEIIDVPVRATRSTRQTLKEDTGNPVTNPQADKKRTRRGMKATDLNRNSSHVTGVDKQEHPKRKSLRTRGVDEDEGDKTEVVNASRATRNSKNKADKVEVQELEEPLKPACKKDVNRRKSVLLPDKTEDDPHLEEAVNQPARRNTRRKSVMPKATKTVESPAVERKQSKRLSGVIEDKENVTRSGKDASDNDFKEVTSGTPKSRKRRGTPIIEDQIMKTEYGSLVDKSPKRSTRSASKSEGKYVAKKEVKSSLKKPMSRMNIQLSVEKASHEGKSSAIRSGAIIKESSSKKRAKLSGTKQSDSEDHAVNFTKEGTPVAKLRSFKLDEEVTEPEVSPSIDKSDTRSTIKSVKKEPSQPARFTRSTIKSERKEPSQSAIKEQPIAVQLFSPEVAKFRPDPAVNTAPGRIARRGIKHEGNAAGSFSDKVGKKKQTRQSALKKPHDDAQMPTPEVAEVGPSLDVGTIAVQAEFKLPLDEVQKSSPEDAEVRPHLDVDTLGVQSENKQPYDNVQMCSPEVAEVQPNPDGDTLGVGSESSKEVTGQTLGDISASESARLPTKTVEENRVSVSGTAIDLESASLVSGENASVEFMEDAGACIESSTHEANVTQCLTENLLSGKQHNSPELQNFDAETMPDADDAETLPDAVSDVSCVQNQNKEAYVESEIFSEAVNLETSVLNSGRSPVSIGVDVQENPSSGNDVFVECDDAISDQKSFLDMFGTPLIGKGGVRDDGSSVAKELSNASKTIDVPVSGIDIDIERVVKDTSDTQNGESEHEQLTSDANHATEKEDAGGDDSEPAQVDGSSVAKEPETGSELSNANKTLDVPVSGIDIDIERAVDTSDVQNGESEHDQLTSNANHATYKEDVGDDDSEPAQNENMPVAAEVFVRSHDQQPEQSLHVAVGDVPGDTVGQSDSVTSKDAPKTLATSGIDDVVVKVDAVGQSDSVVDINKDVSSILGDIYDMDVECDGGNEQKLTEGDEDFQPNESGCISSDMSKEQTNEEAETSRGYGHALDDQEQVAATDDDLDSGKFMEDGSHIGASEVGSELLENIKAQVDPAREEASPILNTEGELTVGGIDSSQLMGDIGAHESPITKESLPVTYKNEESHVDDTDSNLPTIKKEDRNKQEDTQNASTSVDWGDYDFAMDEFEKPVSANGSADVKGKGKIDDQDSDLQTSDRTSFHIEESSDLAAGLADSARTLKKDYRNAADGKSNQEVDMLKESANATDMTEVFNWSGADSSMKSLFATPAATRISHVRDSQDDAAKFANQDTCADSSMKSLFAAPAATRISHVRDCQDDAAKFANQDTCADSSMKSLFATPAATRISHVRDCQDDAAKFANQDTCADSSLKSLFATPGATQIGHVRDSQDDAAKFANPYTYSSLKPLPDVTQSSRVKDGLDVKTGSEDGADFANQDHYSSLKSLFKTPAATQTSHVKDGEGGAVDFANLDHYSSLKPLFKTPAVTQTSHVKGGQEDAVHYANQDPYSSLKPFFTTPATTQISHVKDAQEEATNCANKDSSLKSLFATPATSRPSHVNDRKTDAVNFTFPDGRCSEDIRSSRTAAHEFNHQWGNDQSKDFNGETQGRVVQGPENVMHGGPSFEDNFSKLFENDIGGSVDRSGSYTNFEAKQFEFLNEAAGTSHRNPSSLKDNLTCSRQFENKEDTSMKGSEVNDDLAFDTGHMHDYRGNNEYSNK